MQVCGENKYYGIRYIQYIFLYQGILGMLSAIFGQQFFYDCYNPVGEMMDMMALINSAANYILYCLMSSDFRQTLRKLSGLEDKTVKTTVTITTKYEVQIFAHVCMQIQSTFFENRKYDKETF